MDSQLNHTKSETALHKYVLICLGCLFLFLASFPVAYWRVTQKMSKGEKLPPLPLKSQEWNQNQQAHFSTPN